MNKLKTAIVIFFVVFITGLLLCAQNFTDIPSQNQSSFSNEESGDWGNSDSSTVSDTDSESEESSAPHTHQAKDEWAYNGEKHWKECFCGEEMQTAPHSYYQTDETPNTLFCECGYYKTLPVKTLTKRLDVCLDILVKDGQAVLNADGKASVMIEELDENHGKLFFVAFDGEKIDGATLSEKTLTFSTKHFGFAYGESTIEILTENASYLLPVNLVSKTINTKEELSIVNVIAKACETQPELYGGYFKLGKDIAYNGSWTGGIATEVSKLSALAGKGGFQGVFDGCGYAIEGLIQDGKESFGGFIGVLCGGTIKNISFTKASLLYQGGLVCAAGVGNIQNVYVEYAQLGCEEYNPNATIGAFFGSWVESGATLRNCFIDCRQASVINGEEIYSIGITANEQGKPIDGVLSGVYVLGAPLRMKAVASGLTASEKNVFATFSTAENMQNDESVQEVIKMWSDTVWKIEDGIPTFKK